MFKKVLKQSLIHFFLFIFFVRILPRILGFIFSGRKLIPPNTFLPLWCWILLFIVILFKNFMIVRTNNKNWPWKKK